MKIIIDNNIWISFMIGKKLSMLKALFFRDDIDIYVCDELLREFCEVSKRSKIQKYISIQDIEDTLVLIEERCFFVEINKVADSAIRDAKDLYLLSLADTVSADYIVTGDKDLLVLKQHGTTKIVTYTDFNQLLA